MAANQIEFVGVEVTSISEDSINSNVPKQVIPKNSLKRVDNFSRISTFVKPDPDGITFQPSTPNVFDVMIKEELSDSDGNDSDDASFKAMIYSLKCEENTLSKDNRRRTPNINKTFKPIDIKPEAVAMDILKCEPEEPMIICDSGSNLVDVTENRKMDDEQLIKLIRKYPALYDLSHPKYMDNSFKHDIWSNIGKQMKVDGLSCKARWNNIRDNYRKSLKKTTAKSGQNSKRIKLYKYTEQLSFLTKYFDERETKGSIGGQDGEEERRQDDSGEPDVLGVSDDFQRQSSPSPNLHPSQSPNRQPSQSRQRSPSPNRKSTRNLALRRMVAKRTASATLMEYLIGKHESRVKSKHPIDAFLAGVAPTLKNLSPYYQNLAKSEIFAAVQKFEMKMLTDPQHSHQVTSDTKFNDVPLHSASSSSVAC